MTAAQLKLVPPAPERVDIYAGWKADIARIDWSATHIAADRRQPIDLADAPKRTWFR